MNKIITIGREFGSGGRELGRRLAEELGFEYYDKEIVTEISKHTSLSEEYVKHVVENAPHALFPITVGRSFSYADDYSIKQIQTVYAAKDEIIKELAEKSNCIIVGRCADYILKDYNPYKIFVYADLESKIKRCVERLGPDDKWIGAEPVIMSFIPIISGAISEIMTFVLILPIRLLRK